MKEKKKYFICVLFRFTFETMKWIAQYNVFYLKISPMCIFNAVKKQSGIGFIVDVLIGNFAYLNSLYTAVEVHTNSVLIQFFVFK